MGRSVHYLFPITILFPIIILHQVGRARLVFLRDFSLLSIFLFIPASADFWLLPARLALDTQSPPASIVVQRLSSQVALELARFRFVTPCCRSCSSMVSNKKF